MTHAIRARKERGAKIVVIDIYDNATMKQADMALLRAARHRRRARLRGHARAVPRRLRGPGLSRPIHRLSARARSASRRRARRNGRRPSPACRSPRSRPSRGSSARRKRTYLPARLRLLAASATARSTCTPPPASRPSPAPGSTRAAAPSTTTARIYHWRKTPDRGPRRRRPDRAPARPVADRPRPHRRSRGAAATARR